jgi:lipoprotein-releasing system ATP-binding protein
MNKGQGMEDVLILKDIHQHFTQGEVVLNVLKGVNLNIKPGEVVGLIGQSGSGKSTLLHIAGLLEKPAKGSVIIKGEVLTDARDNKRTAIRRDEMGFIYQFHHLLPEFTALENVIIPQRIADVNRLTAEPIATDLLTKMGLAERLEHRPSEMSGGEQQRVAIARALANNPSLLLADEPTGNLDEATATGVFDQLLEIIRGQRVGALIATHNIALSKRMDRCVALSDGKLVDV